MVQVRKHSYINDAGDADLNTWISQLAVSLDDTEVARLIEACELALHANETASNNIADWAQTSDCFYIWFGYRTVTGRPACRL